MTSYLQKILFGGPGIGKSHKIDNILEKLNIDPDSSNCIKTVFHPEYSYGDFMGKLLPITKEGRVEYKYYPGHFLQALAKSYKNILIDQISPKPVSLVIDEINRGNSSAIFGTIFQLLDRDDNGWSCYRTTLSEVEYLTLLERIGIKHVASKSEYTIEDKVLKNSINDRHAFLEARENEMKVFNEKILSPININNMSIKIPPNMSILATMNTSDNSIFYMDSAFKRRWDWEFIKGERQNITIDNKYDWCLFIDNLNKFFIANSKSIRQIEDKQIGYWFIKPKNKNSITSEEISNKLLFFIWDSVFSRDKTSLQDLLKIKSDELITFSQFADQCSNFIEKIINYK
ncbi:hypothetical protein J9253_04905 [Thiothrix litoralis]|uniref:AAA domain (Dynein-related subfamily) n=1 Tax=Thiothrix litoralis TaxID=2891210 RepID=A0ABX7WVG2_9GAMM|nr:hypothetical protein [Thiothrix litoralis]QTR47281.1 hypothetical protein J9253_04905 [Thiothrix litoralis]